MRERVEFDFNALTDLRLRLHRDFDYLDDDMLELRVANTLINLLEGV